MAPDSEQIERVPLMLPEQLVTKADVSRIIREVESLDGFFLQSTIKGAQGQELPQLSRQLNIFVSLNKLNVLIKEDREAVKTYLTALKNLAPVIHISFAAEPRPDFLFKLIAWFRTSVHPQVLLQVGLRPSIAAGCVIRTTNKFFDLSIHKNLIAAKPKLVEAITGGGS